MPCPIRAFGADFGGLPYVLDVTAVHADGWSESYAYDEAGNQTAASWTASMPGQERTGPRTYTGTRITRAGDIRYEHDAAGRIVLRRNTGCHAIPTPGATPGTPRTASPASSPRTAPGGVTSTIRSAAGPDRTHHHGRRFQEEVDRRFFLIVTDLVDTPTGLVDESGDIVRRSRTRLWGTTTWS